MKKKMILVFAIGALACSAFAAPMATLADIKGKVEVKQVNGTWVPATEGMKIDLATTISTGFDATVTLAIDKTTVVVKPLTRLTLDKLLEQSPGSTSTSLFLRVGSVQAKVKATVPGTPQDFKVQSPYSTASVRGTEFEFDGLQLRVTEGVVRQIPGRPHRDIQTAADVKAATEGEATGAPGADAAIVSDADSGFDGSVDVGAADETLSVSVAQNQQSVVSIAYSLDSGSSAPSVGQTGTSTGTNAGSVYGIDTTGGTGTSKRITTTRAGGVTITITE